MVKMVKMIKSKSKLHYCIRKQYLTQSRLDFDFKQLVWLFEMAVLRLFVFGIKKLGVDRARMAQKLSLFVYLNIKQDYLTVVSNKKWAQLALCHMWFSSYDENIISTGFSFNYGKMCK